MSEKEKRKKRKKRKSATAKKENKKRLTRQLPHAGDGPRSPDELARDEQGVVAVEGVAILCGWCFFFLEREAARDRGCGRRRRRHFGRGPPPPHRINAFSFVFARASLLPSAASIDSHSASMDATRSRPDTKLTLRSKKRSAPPGDGGSALNHATNALSLLASLVEHEKGVRPAVAALVVVAPAMAGREGAGVAMTRRRRGGATWRAGAT